jgi:AraC-like DNA-binding protein
MSQKRQRAILNRLAHLPGEMATLTYDYPAGHVISWHYHDRDQLVYASRGVMTVRTEAGTWVVPTQRAVWIPARVAHTITMSGRVAMRTLYIKPGLARRLPRACCVVNVPTLLRELILHACEMRGWGSKGDQSVGALQRRVRKQRPVIDLILDQLEAIQMVGLQLPHVSDDRAARVAELLVNDPSNRRTLAQLCRKAGAGKRTVERLFQEQAGMSFGKWRQQLRLMQAVRLLAQGAKVTHAAMEAGYSSPSAFIVVFKKILGTTPRIYFSGRSSSI